MSRSYRPPPRPSRRRIDAELVFQCPTGRHDEAHGKALTARRQPDNPTTKPMSRARNTCAAK